MRLLPLLSLLALLAAAPMGAAQGECRITLPTSWEASVVVEDWRPRLVLPDLNPNPEPCWYP